MATLVMVAEVEALVTVAEVATQVTVAEVATLFMVAEVALLHVTVEWEVEAAMDGEESVKGVVARRDSTELHHRPLLDLLLAASTKP